MRATTSDPSEEPMNLGPAVNSSRWDCEPTLSHDGLMLYFNSNRGGGLGNHNIWQVSIDPVVDLNSDGIVDVQDLIVLAEHLFEEVPLAESVE